MNTLLKEIIEKEKPIFDYARMLLTVAAGWVVILQVYVFHLKSPMMEFPGNIVFFIMYIPLSLVVLYISFRFFVATHTLVEGALAFIASFMHLWLPIRYTLNFIISFFLLLAPMSIVLVISSAIKIAGAAK